MAFKMYTGKEGVFYNAELNFIFVLSGRKEIKTYNDTTGIVQKRVLYRIETDQIPNIYSVITDFCDVDGITKIGDLE